MSQYKNNELKPRGWKIVVTSDETTEDIEQEIDDMLRKISNRVRMDLCFQMTDKEVEDMYGYKNPLGEEGQEGKVPLD